MNKEPVILCDVDGVLVDFTETYLRLNAELNKRYHVEADITSFNFAECITTPEQDKKIWRHIERSPGMVYNLPLYDGARDFLAALRECGRVVACTSPANPLWTAERAQFLMDKCGFHKKDIVIASDKALVVGDYLIDDAVHNLDSWQHWGSLGILMTRPWNLSDDKHYRVKTYEDVLKTLTV